MLRRHELVFVAGAHGVGKTTFCKAFATAYDAEHVSASTLIRSARARAESETKRVSDIQGNQDELVSALRQHECKASILLLDGHFCLVTETGHIERIPQATFSAIAPTAIVLLEAEVLLVQERMRRRGGTVLPVATLRRLQQKEAEHAAEVAEAIGAPLLALTEPFRQSEAEVFIASVCRTE